MALADKTLICRECGAEFVFSVGEQEFYKGRGLLNEPARCPECRSARRRSRTSGSSGYGEGKSYKVTCADCGAETSVPFLPSQGRPVYCSACFAKRRRSGPGA